MIICRSKYLTVTIKETHARNKLTPYEARKDMPCVSINGHFRHWAPPDGSYELPFADGVGVSELFELLHTTIDSYAYFDTVGLSENFSIVHNNMEVLADMAGVTEEYDMVMDSPMADDTISLTESIVISILKG